ncbi:hypothetical protein [Microlunatus sp. GCM10028923]|uniref:hypothetical protein n=1 Tax=Microlunatus sp. GCM10028923 TaxID=3273400 RepID=UPI00362096FC
MITVPLVLLMLGIAFLMIKFGKQKPVPMVFGVLVGVVLASTPAGPPIADGIEWFCQEALKAAQAGLNEVGKKVA